MLKITIVAVETTKNISLSHMWMRTSYGSSLLMDKSVCRCKKSSSFFIICSIFMAYSCTVPYCKLKLLLLTIEKRNKYIYKFNMGCLGRNRSFISHIIRINGNFSNISNWFKPNSTRTYEKWG